ncbi:uncharacterized protein PG998_011808 [Apiospora kogelbergensis]|uniref:uncharacterized protein n=1 Tax=Apiospora kogelbergensis TaxID=1337665 RepID=UPI00312E0488
MQNLPLEIIDNIVEFLPTKEDATEQLLEPRLAPYTTISTHFLEAVQRRLWRRLFLFNDDLDYCASFLLHRRRLSHLRELTLHIIVDETEENKALCFERPAETKAVSRQFGICLQRVFGMLEQGTNLQLSLFEVEHNDTGRYDGHEHRFQFYQHSRSRITLPRANGLPMLHSVRHLSFYYWIRRPDPSVQLVIAARMPELWALDLCIEATELRYLGVLRKDRQSLAEALVNYSKQTEQLSHVDLHIANESSHLIDNTVAMPNVKYPLTYDLLGSSLRVWLQRLTSFNVGGVFDEALF